MIDETHHFLLTNTFSSRGRKWWTSSNLDATQQHQDEHNQQYQTQATAGAVTPTAAVRPGWNGTEEHQDQQDQENGSEWHGCLLS